MAAPEIAAVNGRKAKAFFAFSKKAGYSGQEQRYIRRYFGIFHARCVYLLAFIDGRVCGRLMTWQSVVKERNSSSAKGFFALLDGTEMSFSPLLRRAEDIQRSWGSTELIGPIAPDGSGWFMGQCDRGKSGGSLTGPGDRGQTAALKKAGYRTLQQFNAYNLSIPRENTYRESAQRFAKRLGLKAVHLSNGLFSQRLSKAVYDVEADNKKLLARQAEKLKPFLDTNHSFAVQDRTGNYHGYVFCLKGERPRLSTIITKENALRRPVTALLVSSVLDSFLNAENTKVELSVIDAANIASNRLAQSLGGTVDRCYLIYHKKLT